MTFQTHLVLVFFVKMCVSFGNEIRFLSKLGSSQLCGCNQCWMSPMFKLDLSASVKRGVQIVMCWTPCELREIIYMLICMIYMIWDMIFRLWIYMSYDVMTTRGITTHESNTCTSFNGTHLQDGVSACISRWIEAGDWKLVNFLTKHTFVLSDSLCLKIPGCINK